MKFFKWLFIGLYSVGAYMSGYFLGFEHADAIRAAISLELTWVFALLAAFFSK